VGYIPFPVFQWHERDSLAVRAFVVSVNIHDLVIVNPKQDQSTPQQIGGLA